MYFDQQLELYLRARCPLLVVVTTEEERLLQFVCRVAAGLHQSCVSWDVAEGFQALTQGTATFSGRDPLSALEQIDRASADGIFLLRDFHDCWSNSTIRRKLRSLAQRLKFSKKSIMISTPLPKVPEELRDEAVVVSLPPPTIDELEAVLDRLTQTPGVLVQLSDCGKEQILQAALGLTTAQAQRVFAKAIVTDGILDDHDVGLVREEKRLLIRETEALEYYPGLESDTDVGGLDALKHWLRLRERAFTSEAKSYGLPSPKGIALIGIPGSGKSLVAKMIAGTWRLPLFRLDAGSLFGSLVGESEERTRRALRVAESTAPAILWIDEIEKSLAHGGLDSGTSARVFGSILTWMQEKTAPLFIVATANDIRSLPAELLRKGRFDEVFFLDLPDLKERMEILSVHLRKRRRSPDNYALESLAKASEGFVGAELEQAIIDAMYVGFNSDREFSSTDVLNAIRRQVPLSVSQRETVHALRVWLREGRAVSATGRNSPEMA